MGILLEVKAGPFAGKKAAVVTGQTMTFIPFARVIARTVSRPDTPTIPEAPEERGAAPTARGLSARTVAKRAAGRFLQSEKSDTRRLRMAPKSTGRP